MSKNYLIVILTFIFVANIFGQDSDQPAFGQLAILASYNHNLSIGDLDELWKNKLGTSFRVETPFYFGHISIGADYNKFASYNVIQPDFKTFFISMMLNKKLELFLKTKLSAGIKFGSYLMLFDDTDATEFESTESELAIGANFRYEVPITKHFVIYTSTDFTTVFTRKRLKFWDVSGGLQYVFSSPNWFKELMD